MAKTAASDKNKSAPAKKTQRSKISVTLGRKRGKKGGRSAAEDGESEEQMFEPMPDHYPGISTQPVTCLTAASPFWELEDMQPSASAGVDGAAGMADDATANDSKGAAAMETDDNGSVSELDFGTSKNKGTSASKHKKATDAATAKPKIGGRLRPGQALQRCSGADVMLSKSAMNRPNSSKSKGRYLIILPGGLYPRVPGAEERERLVGAQKADAGSDGAAGSADMNVEDTTTTPNEKKRVGGVDDDDDVKIIDNGVDDSGKMANPTDATTTPNKPAPFTPSTAPSVLGQLQKLGTDTPILRIPFPDGQVMLLKGRKVSLTTSYLSLTCKSTGRGGQGTVTCKDIFAGAIVFGDVGWEDNGATANAAAPAAAVDGEAAETRSVRHFGPSERTIDGGRAVKGGTSRYSSSVKRGTSSLSRRSASSPMRLSDNDGDEDDEFGSDASPILHDDDTDEDDDDEAFVGRASDSPVVKRQASSRRSGARVNYADMIKDSDAEEDDEDGSDENGGDDDDSSVEEVIPAKKKRSPPKKAVTQKPAPKPKATSTKKKSPASSSSAKKKTPPAKKVSKKSDSESDFDGGDDDDVIAINVSSGASKTPSSTGRQRKKISYAENSDGSGDDDNEAFSEEEKKGPSAKKKAAAKTPTNERRGGTSTKKAAISASSKKKAAVKVSKPKSEPIEINDDDSEEKKVDDTSSSSAAKAAPRSPEPTSAARRRKKKASPKKSPAGGGSAKKRKLDMDDDDKFFWMSI